MTGDVKSIKGREGQPNLRPPRRLSDKRTSNSSTRTAATRACGCASASDRRSPNNGCGRDSEYEHQKQRGQPPRQATLQANRRSLTTAVTKAVRERLDRVRRNMTAISPNAYY